MDLNGEPTERSEPDENSRAESEPPKKRHKKATTSKATKGKRAVTARRGRK